MYKKIFLAICSVVLVSQNLLSKDLPVKNQDVSPQQLEKQNKQITKLAAEQLSKNLPQIINKYTTMVIIKAINTTLVYTSEINTGAKSDETIRNEDRKKWEKIFIKNVCQRSKRFLDAQVKLSYVYISAISKEKLFQFDITQDKCFNLR
jgi:hypothetical protein